MWSTMMMLKVAHRCRSLAMTFSAVGSPPLPSSLPSCIDTRAPAIGRNSIRVGVWHSDGPIGCTPSSVCALPPKSPPRNVGDVDRPNVRGLREDGRSRSAARAGAGYWGTTKPEDMDRTGSTSRMKER